MLRPNPNVIKRKKIRTSTRSLPVLKAVDFFCGAGGVTAGFTQAGIKVLAGIDIDPNCQATYEENNKGSLFLKKDISVYQPKELAKKLKIRRNDKNLVFIGCSPCQYYSSVNNIKDKSAKGKLLLEDFQRFVDYFKPGYIFIENVPGLKRNPESPLGKFKQFLTDSGYHFSDSVLNAKHFSVPQNRRRYVLLATRVSDTIAMPAGNRVNLVSVREAIGNPDLLPPIGAGHKDPTDFIHSTARLNELNMRRIKLTSQNGGSRADWADEPDLQLECYKGYDGHGDVYGRLHWERPSPTITTKFYSLSNGRYGHPEQDRALSLREGAILQSFSLDYKFLAPSQGINGKLIGNAVPPRMAKEIGNTLLNNRRDAAIQSQSQGN
jgi:DNA (cytosine-5)-methyltransferase 1